MFCETCGSPIEEDDLFCRKCGRALTNAVAEGSPRVCSRESQGRMIAGVCAGCASYFSKDVTLIRIVWVLAALIPPLFPGIAAYMISWLLMPAPQEAPPAESKPEHAAASK